jgi:protein-S-isoprenylcysteine O-methyltransferase Ste14
MTSPLIVILATTLYAVMHSLLASLGAKARARQWFGPVADRWYRLLYNIFATISFLPILGLLAILPDRTLYITPSPWILLTSIGQLVGIVIIVFGIWQADAWSFIGLRQIVSHPQPDEQPELTTDGLYLYMRHPLYTGGIILIWLTPLMTVNTLTLNIIVTLYLIIGARFEESRLLHEFGQAYADYQRQVPMLIPRFRGEDQ